uniref:nascent polypeptide-associated complex subunit alpha, muscle-specific form-like n=1 Tax=Panthera onca TaxID=9690 RepID=UPI00295415C2|nr:nascent polypeptide-associated complex subunit alpha, muscle-specific form-like [Panthera onca]
MPSGKPRMKQLRGFLACGTGFMTTQMLTRRICPLPRSRWPGLGDLAPLPPPRNPPSGSGWLASQVTRVSCAPRDPHASRVRPPSAWSQDLVFPLPLPPQSRKKGEAGDVIIRALAGGATVHNGTKTSGPSQTQRDADAACAINPVLTTHSASPGLPAPSPAWCARSFRASLPPVFPRPRVTSALTTLSRFQASLAWPGFPRGTRNSPWLNGPEWRRREQKEQLSKGGSPPPPEPQPYSTRPVRASAVRSPSPRCSAHRPRGSPPLPPLSREAAALAPGAPVGAGSEEQAAAKRPGPERGQRRRPGKGEAATAGGGAAGGDAGETHRPEPRLSRARAPARGKKGEEGRQRRWWRRRRRRRPRPPLPLLQGGRGEQRIPAPPVQLPGVNGHFVARHRRAWDAPGVGLVLGLSESRSCLLPPPALLLKTRRLCRAVMQWSLQDGLFLNWSFLRLTNAGTSSSISGL